MDRQKFSSLVEEKLAELGVTVVREEAVEEEKEGVTIIACGPMVSDAMARRLAQKCGAQLHFYDAVAPIFAARYGKGEADYLNCPLDKEEYLALREALLTAEKAMLHDFEKGDVFEGCMPIEALAARGEDAMRFGPLRPVGLETPDGSGVAAAQGKSGGKRL